MKHTIKIITPHNFTKRRVKQRNYDVFVLQAVGTDRKAVCTDAICERLSHNRLLSSLSQQSNCVLVLRVVIQARHNSNVCQLTILSFVSPARLHCSKHAYTANHLEATMRRMLLAVRLATFRKETLAFEIHLTSLCEHDNTIVQNSLQNCQLFSLHYWDLTSTYVTVIQCTY